MLNFSSKRMNDRGEIYTYNKVEEGELHEIEGKVAYYNGIKDGRPFSCTETGGDYGLFTDLPVNEQKLCCEWVNKYCIPSATYHRYRTSYGMQHSLENCTGIYMTNNQFKDLMLIKGFEPKNPRCLNWSFKVRNKPLKDADAKARPSLEHELERSKTLGYEKHKPTIRLNGRVTCFYCEGDVSSDWKICPNCYTEIDWD